MREVYANTKAKIQHNLKICQSREMQKQRVAKRVPRNIKGRRGDSNQQQRRKARTEILMRLSVEYLELIEENVNFTFFIFL